MRSGGRERRGHGERRLVMVRSAGSEAPLGFGRCSRAQKLQEGKGNVVGVSKWAGVEWRDEFGSEPELVGAEGRAAVLCRG